jgi:hypothetical protein
MLDAYRDLIDGLTEESTTLRELLGTPVPDDLAPDVVEALREIRGREAAMLRRSQSIMRGENINLRSIENEPEVREAAASTGTPEDLMGAFVHDRGELVSLLMNLTLKDWERKVPHYTLGETTLSDEIETHLNWEEESLDRVKSLLGVA